MTTYRITTPQPVTNVIGAYHDPAQSCRIVLGVGYTSNEAIVEYARRKLFDLIEVDEVPAEYIDQCARLEAFPVELRGTPVIDNLDLESLHKVTGPDGRTYDIRDIIDGVVAAGPEGLLITGQQRA